MFMFMGFLYLFVTATADDYDVFSGIFYDKFLPSPLYYKSSRLNPHSNPYKKTKVPTNKCNIMYETQSSNYVAILLYKTSGRFMGMAGIINTKTIITSMDVLKFNYGDLHDIRVLAGYFSPWWGKNAQVRNCKQMFASDFELLLIEVEPAWKIGSTVGPVELKKFSEAPLSAFGDNFFVYGIRTGSSFNPGDFLAKGSAYMAALHTLTKGEECEKDYDIKSYNSTIYMCLSPNETFCKGCIGSPVMATKKSSHIKEIVGVVIRSTCTDKIFKILAVNAPFFESWITSNTI